MTKEEFATLQLRHRESGMSLKDYLKEINVGYSTYNYRRKKFLSEETLHELAPITFKQSGEAAPSQSFVGDVPSGATLLFPNGLRAHFGLGTENLLMEVVLQKSLSGHVLP